MATKTIVQVLCDMPHPEDVEGFAVTITTPEGTWDLDVCADHAGPLLDLVSVGRRQGRTRRRVGADVQ